MKKVEYKIYGLRIIGEDRVWYVGRTMSLLSTRWSKHKTNARLSKTNNHRSNWINKYKDEIEIFLIEGGLDTKEQSCDRERYYIALYREKYGSLTNSSNGGDGGCEGYKHTEEAKKKISEAHKGRKFSDEHIKNIKNRVISEETRKKLSKSSKKYILENGNPMTGKKRPDNAERNKARVGWRDITEEERKKKSVDNMGDKNPNYKHGYYSKEEKEKRKRVYKFTKEDVVVIRDLYKTGNYTHKEIGEMYDASAMYISQIIRGIKWKSVPL